MKAFKTIPPTNMPTGQPGLDNLLPWTFFSDGAQVDKTDHHTGSLTELKGHPSPSSSPGLGLHVHADMAGSYVGTRDLN